MSHRTAIPGVFPFLAALPIQLTGSFVAVPSRPDYRRSVITSTLIDGCDQVNICCSRLNFDEARDERLTQFKHLDGWQSGGGQGEGCAWHSQFR
jgi:hypothetical protein